ncbi:hypothetical protein JCM3765_004757 [Sporobolomyces pararoseus]
MGRRKISIAPISDDRNRQVTFLKRKNGLFKKAYELGVLCSADVAVVVFNANGKLFEFGSGDLDQILLRYSHYTGLPHEKKGPQDYANKQDLAVQAANTASANNTQRRGSSTNRDDDDDEDDDDEDGGAGGGEEMDQDGNESVVSTSSSIKGKGKQALVAANARQSRQNSMTPNYPPNFPPPPPSQPHSRANSHPATHQQDPSTSSSSTSYPNYNHSFPPPHSQSQPQTSAPYQPFPAPSASTSHQQQPQPAPFFPAFPPPPPNPLELFQMNGLFPPPTPQSLPNGSNQQQQQPQVNQFGAGMFGPFGLGGMGNPFPSFPTQLSQSQPPPTSNGNNGGAPSSAASNYFNTGLGGFPGMNMNGGGMLPNFYNGTGAAQSPNPTQEGGGEGNNNGAGGSGGVPNWFGAQNPMMAAAAAAALMYQQQQQHQQQQQQQRSQPPHSSPAATKSSIERPSTTSSLSPPPSHARTHPTRQDSANSNNGSKPRLNLTIPKSTSSSLEQNRKVGLVTAGGASILGKGISNARGDTGGERRGNGETGGNEEEEDEDSQPTAVPKSAFASDLLAAQSPFYPHPNNQQHPSTSSNPYNYPLSAASHQFGQWPNTNRTTFKPAPMLGESEAPDLIRASPEEVTSNGNDEQSREGGEEAVQRRLKRGSVDLEEGIEGLGMEEESEGSQASGSGESGSKKRRS